MKFWVFLLFFCIFPAFAQSFLPETEDIPLMDGLTDIETTAVFESPSERMVLISAETSKSKKQILKYYQNSLVNLGWKESKALFFERGSDSFFIEVIPLKNKNKIQFRLTQSNF